MVRVEIVLTTTPAEKGRNQVGFRLETLERGENRVSRLERSLQDSVDSAI
jgi:hypothetical protein